MINFLTFNTPSHKVILSLKKEVMSLEKKSSHLLVLPFIVLITCLQTGLSILPGVLFLRHSSQGPFILPYLIIYLLISDFFQLIGKATYKKGQFVSVPVYSVKIIISCLLIFLIGKETAIQFIPILIAYEIFQLLIFSKQFFYIDSIFYSLTNAFFKGIVFNQLLTISYPFDYHFSLMKPFIFSFLIWLLLTVLTQGMYSFLSKHGLFLSLSLVSLVAIYYLLINQYLDQSLSLIQLFIFIITTIGTIFFFLKSKNSRKKELVISCFALLSVFIYYF